VKIYAAISMVYEMLVGGFMLSENQLQNAMQKWGRVADIATTT
jgi:hypothetical protein